MLRSTFYQVSLPQVEPDTIGLDAGSFERGLRDVLLELVSLDDFQSFHPSTDGAPTCCPLVLTGMLLLQYRYNIPDERLIERCWRDLGFRYALGLVGTTPPPRVSSLRRFRAWVRQNKGPDWLHRLVLSLAKEDGLIADADLQAVDSTNTECRGAVIDSYNLVATGIGRVVRLVAGCLGEPADALAARWGLSRYLARSVKGTVKTDWSDEAQRNALITEEIGDADRLPRLLKGLGAAFPDTVTEALTLLAKVARQDVEELPDGTFKIAQGTARDRTISMTDQAARHGRKSSSQTITGFKVHVQGTIESQFVTGIAMTPANASDAGPTLGLIQQAEAVGLKPKVELGDNAYGTGANVRACIEAGVVLRTKLPAPSHKCFTKRDFAIDLAKLTVTCPNGATTTTYSMVRTRAARASASRGSGSRRRSAGPALFATSARRPPPDPPTASRIRGRAAPSC
jgi:hypothetical protein